MNKIQNLILPLTEKYVDDVKILCDQSVGEGFFTSQYIINAINSKNHFFNILLNSDNEVIGYNYNYICSFNEISHEYDIQNIYDKNYQHIGVTKSMGIRSDYRNNGLALDLLDYGIKELFLNGAEVLFATAWKKGDYIPIKGIFDCLGFEYVKDLDRPWYKLEGMKCPYCKQNNCICNAAVYIKTRLDDIA